MFVVNVRNREINKVEEVMKIKTKIFLFSFMIFLHRNLIRRFRGRLVSKATNVETQTVKSQIKSADTRKFKIPGRTSNRIVDVNLDGSLKRAENSSLIPPAVFTFQIVN